jgi:hypothetical protein
MLCSGDRHQSRYGTVLVPYKFTKEFLWKINTNEYTIGNSLITNKVRQQSSLEENSWRYAQRKNGEPSPLYQREGNWRRLSYLHIPCH